MNGKLAFACPAFLVAISFLVTVQLGECQQKPRCAIEPKATPGKKPISSAQMSQLSVIRKTG